MSNIYISEHGTKVAKEGGQIVITTQSGKVQRLPITYVENLIIVGKTQVTYDAVCSIMKSGGSILYMDWDGSIMGSMGNNNINQRQMLRQLQVYQDSSTRLETAAYFVREKIKAQRETIAKYSKQYRDIELYFMKNDLDKLLDEVAQQSSVEALLGVEGIASKRYFEAMGAMLLRNDNFVWLGRHKHPAPDPLNAMLSFAYSLLEKDVRRALSVAGLNTSIGFLHSLDLRKDSLVYDVMEPFRPSLADRLVLKCVNLKMFGQSDFSIRDGACIFTKEARSRFIEEYEKFVGDYEDEESMRYRIWLQVVEFKKILMTGAEKVA